MDGIFRCNLYWIFRGDLYGIFRFWMYWVCRCINLDSFWCILWKKLAHELDKVIRYGLHEIVWLSLNRVT